MTTPTTPTTAATAERTAPVLRRNPLTLSWVLYNDHLPFAPVFVSDNPQPQTSERDCFFCGDDDESFRNHGISELLGPDGKWKARVQTSPYGLFTNDGKLLRRGEGLYDEMNAIGIHEVVVETPHHTMRLHEYTQRDLTDIINLWQARLLVFRDNPQCQTTQVNRGFRTESSGRNILHPQTHLMGIPLIPASLHNELTQTMEYWTRKERCMLCDILAQDTGGDRFVYENRCFAVLAPYAASAVAELLIIPKHHTTWFHNMPDEQAPKFADAILTATTALNKIFPDSPFELMLRHAPTRPPKKFDTRNARLADYSHWYFTLSPFLQPVNAMNMRSDFRAVPVLPETTAQQYRNAISG